MFCFSVFKALLELLPHDLCLQTPQHCHVSVVQAFGLYLCAVFYLFTPCLPCLSHAVSLHLPALQMSATQLPHEADIADPRVDLGEVHQGLLAEDGGLAGDQLHNGLMDNPVFVPEKSRSLFQRLPARSVTLSALKDMHAEKNIPRALAVLYARSRLNIDDAHVVRPEEDRTIISNDCHRLDYVLFVPKSRGLHAIIPTTASDHRFLFSLLSCQQFRSFHIKHGRLGFNAEGRMLLIGRVNNDEVWLAMAPTSAEFGVSDHKGGPSGPTQLSKAHYRMVIIFIALCASKLQRHSVWMCSPDTTSYYDLSLTNDTAEYHLYTDFR
jgi:hypothetical protein